MPRSRNFMQIQHSGDRMLWIFWRIIPVFKNTLRLLRIQYLFQVYVNVWINLSCIPLLAATYAERNPYTKPHGSSCSYFLNIPSLHCSIVYGYVLFLLQCSTADTFQRKVGQRLLAECTKRQIDKLSRGKSIQWTYMFARTWCRYRHFNERTRKGKFVVKVFIGVYNNIVSAHRTNWRIDPGGTKSGGWIMWSTSRENWYKNCS